MCNYDKYSVEELLTEFKDKYIYLSKDEFNLRGKDIDLYFDERILLNKDTQDKLYDNLHDKLIDKVISQVNTTNHTYFHFNHFGIVDSQVYLEFYQPNIGIVLTEGMTIEDCAKVINTKLKEVDNLQQKELLVNSKLKEYTLEEHFKVIDGEDKEDENR